MKELTELGKMRLRGNVNKEFEKIEKIYQNKSLTETLNKYKNYFNLCESTYKVILRDYLIRKDGKADKYLKLDMRQAPAAMKFAGYVIDKELLSRMFGSEEKRGKCSAKVLRDRVTHSIDEKAAEEIVQREKALYKDMDAFLDIVRRG